MKILFLIKDINIEKFTVFLETVRALADRGVKIHIVAASQSEHYVAEPYYDTDPSITKDVLDVVADAQNGIDGLKSFIRKYAWLEKITWLFVNFVGQWTFRLKTKMKQNSSELVFDEFLTPAMKEFKPKRDYDYIWTVDEYGLLWAEWINRHSKVKYKLVHHSFELYWEHYSFPVHKRWQDFKLYALFEQARKVLQNVEKIIIQDEDRWKVLCTYTGLDCKREKFFLPVSIKDYPVNISGNIYEEMKIEKNKKVILYPTTIMPSRGCLELVKAAQQLDSQFVTVLHGFAAIQEYLIKVKKAVSSPDKVVLSSTPFEYQQLVNIHYDVWCVFLYYEESDNNHKYIVNSSNKLVMALQAGKPIITIGNQTLANLCSEYECGIAINQWETKEFVNAVFELERKYDTYCKNARKCYEERFDIKLYADEIYNGLLSGI